MTSLLLVISLIKVLIVILFLLNMAAIATWADRRQSAMVQDRVGPNRAVVYLPSAVVRGLVFLPALALGGGALASLYFGVDLRIAAERLTLDLQMAVLVVWMSMILLAGFLRRRETDNAFEAWLASIDPRSIFYGALVAHSVALMASFAVPAGLIAPMAQAARAVLAVVLLSAGFYAASRVPEGTIGLRLAGLLHAAADAVKLIWKEDFVPKNGDKLLHALAPMLAMFPALVTFAVIPFGQPICFADSGNGVFDWADVWNGVVPVVARSGVCTGHEVSMQVADLNVGILYIFAMAGTGIIGAAIAGWASDNKFSLLGGLRAASQMVSYEVAMGLSLVGLLLVVGSVRLGDIVEWQRENTWGIFAQPLGFMLFLIALSAETKRVPFDQPEGESEIVAGYFVEYSGMKFGMFYTGEYVELITSSAILTTLFFGGYALPFLHADGLTIAFGGNVIYAFKMSHLAVVVISALTFFGKTIFVTWLQIFVRWTLPRFRYDQVMKLGWTRLLPLALANLLISGVVVLAISEAGEGVHEVLRVLGDVTQAIVAVGALVFVVAVIAGLLEPTKHRRFIGSTASRFAEARGGVKPEPQQA